MSDEQNSKRDQRSEERVASSTPVAIAQRTDDDENQSNTERRQHDHIGQSVFRQIDGAGQEQCSETGEVSKELEPRCVGEAPLQQHKGHQRERPEDNCPL